MEGGAVIIERLNSMGKQENPPKRQAGFEGDPPRSAEQMSNERFIQSKPSSAGFLYVDKTLRSWTRTQAA